MVANWNYSAADMVRFAKTANEYGVNFVVINDKQQLFDYINKDGRENDLIEEMAFFSHGTIFDEHYPNPGYEGQYAIAMGYNGKSEYNALNIFTSDISKIDSRAFATSAYTYFGSCRTGNKFNNKISFAQAWANMSGGLVEAATGSEYNNGRTNYQYIYSKGKSSNFDWWNSILDYASGVRNKRSDSRADYGFSTSGSLNYPIVDDGGRFEEFYPNFY